MNGYKGRKMKNYALLLFALLGLIVSLLSQTDFRAGERRLFRKTKLKENSILRKISFFKETDDNPLLYAKIIPVLVQIILLIGIIVFYIIYWINPELVGPFFNRWQYKFLVIMVFFHN